MILFGQLGLALFTNKKNACGHGRFVDSRIDNIGYHINEKKKIQLLIIFSSLPECVSHTYATGRQLGCQTHRVVGKSAMTKFKISFIPNTLSQH